MAKFVCPSPKDKRVGFSLKSCLGVHSPWTYTATMETWWLFPKFFSANIILVLYGLGMKSKVFCERNNWIKEIMDKGFAVPKIPQKSFVRSAQLAQKDGISLKKALSGVRSSWTKPLILIWPKWQAIHTLDSSAFRLVKALWKADSC